MKLKEMVQLVRQRAKDKDKIAPLWVDAVIIQALNEAQVQACRRARLIKDSTTDEVTLLPLDANTVVYPIDPRVIFIRRVKLNSRPQPLGIKRTRDMDREIPGWEAHIGYLSTWIHDYDSTGIRFYRQVDPTNTLIDPATGANDFVRLTVVREPMEPMSEPDDVPEIAPRFHFKLHHHALELLYSDQDAETYDPKMVEFHAGRFAEEFGAPSSAIEEHWIEENFDYEQDFGVE